MIKTKKNNNEQFILIITIQTLIKFNLMKNKLHQ